MIYDYIIIGSGMGGLGAGLNLAINKKKVLMLEKNSLPGGLVSTFKRGRFEFDVSLYSLYNYGNEKHIGGLQNLFKKMGIEVKTKVALNNTRIKILDSNEDYVLNGDFEEFILNMETMHPGVVDSLREFIKVVKEIHDGLQVLGRNALEEDKYPTFMKYVDMNTIKALEDLKIPQEVIHKLCYLWVELGSPINKLAFVDFAEFMYKVIFKKDVTLLDKNIDLALNLAKEYQNKGGKIYYNSKVIEIKDDGKYKVIVTEDGKEYRAKYVICDLSKRYVYTNLIKKDNKEINRIENARTISPNGVVVYLGLNDNYKTIGLNNYKYYQFETMNSEDNVRKMDKLYHGTWEAIVPNVINENASPSDTTILTIKTTYYGDVWSKVNNSNYLKVKERIAEDLIEQFEKAFNIDIREYIEEVEVITPFTISRYTNNVNGAMMGYMRLGYDNSINRLLALEEERISGISFVGSSSIYGSGVDNAFYSGYYITNYLLREQRGEE